MTRAIGSLAYLVIAVVLSLPATALSANGPCASEAGLEEYLNGLLGEKLQEESKSAGAKTEELKEGASEQAKLRPQGEGAGGGGLDLYKKLFVGLELGSLSEDDGALTFNFRPDLLDLGGFGAVAIRAVVRDPALHEPLADALAALPGEAGSDRRDELSESLDDTDDVEYLLRWSFGDGSPDEAAERVAGEIFEKSWKGAAQQAARDAAETIAAAMREIRETTGATEETSLSEICVTSDDARAAVERASAAVTGKLSESLALLGSSLDSLSFVAVGDLVEGAPALALDLSYRDRAEVVGPDLIAAKLQFQRGDRSVGSWKRWARRTNRGLDAASLADYLTRKRSLADGRTSILLAAEYAETEQFRFLDAALGFALDRPRVRLRSGSIVLGRKLGESRGSRVDLEAKYEDATDDPDRNDRFVSTLSWTQKLSDELAKVAGGSNLVVALVYANRPEYRGDVDRELSVRAGLKWSFEGATKEY